MDINELYAFVEGESQNYEIQSMICFTQNHYLVFVKDASGEGWRLYDDVTVKKVERFSGVAEMVINNKFYPVMLTYKKS